MPFGAFWLKKKPLQCSKCLTVELTTFYISNTSFALLDIKISIEGNGLCSSVYYKPTDSRSYLLYSSSHPSLGKVSISFSQFLRLRLCSDDSDFPEKSEAMSQFFDKRGYPVSVVQVGYHRAQQIDQQSALQTAKKENTYRILFTLTFHPRDHAVKSIILKNFQLLHNDSETSTAFSQPPQISFKREKNIGNLFFWSKVHFKPMTNLELSNALAHDAKLVLSFKT